MSYEKPCTHTWHSARAFAKGEPIPAPESSEYIESAEDDRKDEQTALYAYSISAITPSAHPTLKVPTGDAGTDKLSLSKP